MFDEKLQKLPALPQRGFSLFAGCNYWHGPPPKPVEGVVVNTGGVPWRFGRLVSI
jgi:hypothetical protein